MADANRYRLTTTPIKLGAVETPGAGTAWCCSNGRTESAAR